jgi:hypothetical protein
MTKRTILGPTEHVRETVQKGTVRVSKVAEGFTRETSEEM